MRRWFRADRSRRRTAGALVAAFVLVVGQGPSRAVAQNLPDRCGAAVLDAPPEAPGRWIDWSGDSFAGLEPRPEYGPILGRLSDFADPFVNATVLDPPPGVEVRVQRVIWGDGPPELGSPFPRSTLLIQIFHPTVAVAGEASAKVEVELNSLFPLFYGVAQPIAEDSEGPIFMAPEQVGEIEGAPVFSSGRPRDCMVVFKAHDRPLWNAVSRERYLGALVADIRGQVASGDSAYRKVLENEAAGDSLGDMEAVIGQLRAMDPQAAAEMERQVAALRMEMDRMRLRMVEEAGQVVPGVLEAVGEIEAELAAMSPGERTSQAFVGGLGGSERSLLSSPAAKGSMPLIAVNPGYFEAEAPASRVQLVVVELGSTADHAPEVDIIARLREDVAWGRFWRWVKADRPGG